MQRSYLAMKVIHTRWLANELIKRGCTLIKVEKSRIDGCENLDVWIFENDLKMKNEFEDIMVERRLRQERNKKS